jgi:hypothetical protein
LEDFNALASSLAVGVGDVRGCLILSRDGLILGSHPTDADAHAAPAWMRFAALGDPERGFAQFGTETWCYVRRGPYAGFAVIGPGARPGLVIDHMDQALLAADEARSRHEGLRGIEANAIVPASTSRSHPHPDPPAQEPVVIDVQAPAVIRSWMPEPGELPGRPVPDEAHPRGAAEPTPQPRADPVVEHEPGDPADEEDVDRFSLAREFGQLLQHGEDAADG